MTEFTSMITHLPLYQELDNAVGRDRLEAPDVASLKGLVNDVIRIVGPAMAQIPVTFRQYTVHDIRHCQNVITRMGDILPPETREKLNALEITFLLLSALLHDVGMVVADHEKSETLRSLHFRRFLVEGHAERNRAINEARSGGNEPLARAIEDALLAEYYRRLHPERVRQFMEQHLAGRFQYRGVDFADDLARLCESHAWGVEESNDASKPEKAVARLDDNVRLYGIRVNLQYLACILRLADILDFDRSRTPLVVFQHTDFSEQKSWEEWNKHLQVKGYEITPTQVAFDIPCAHPVFYVAIHEFLGWIDDELRQCRHLVENKPQVTAERYRLLLPQVVDRRKVRISDSSYVAQAFRFQLEYENILALLMDRSLYPDPSLFLRELLQNALDACRRKEADMAVKRLTYKPRIVVWDRTDDPHAPRVVFQDNGVGMSQRIVEQYFLRVGRSYYRSPEFDAERQRLQEQGKELDACSQFGIGILSCFLVGDRFQVETYQEGYDPLSIQIEGPSKYFAMKRLARPEPSRFYQEPSSDEDDGPPNRSGTRITVNFRPNTKVDVWQTLDTFAANTDYRIVVHSPGRKRPRTIPTLRWEKPVRVQDSNFYMDFSRWKIPTLEKALLASVIPFSQWDFSKHLRGTSWLWLLRDMHGSPTPASGFLRAGKKLEFTGVAEIIRQIDSVNDDEEREHQSYSEWITKLEEDDIDYENIEEKDIADSWLELSNKEQEVMIEVCDRRSRVVDSGKLRPWIHRHEDIMSLLTGSLDWADQPLALKRISTFPNLGIELWADQPSVPAAYLRDFRSAEPEDLIALHSILLPAGIVEWNPITATSRRTGLLPFFGGARLDIRGVDSPRPAAHRLFVPMAEARNLRQQFFHAAILHGIDLVARHGRSETWRSWICELIDTVVQLGLDKGFVARTSGRRIEEVCGLAVQLGRETLYLTRAEISARVDGPLYVGGYEKINRLLRRDPVNELLCDFSELTWNEEVEVDLSSLPIRRAKGGSRLRRLKKVSGKS